MASGDASKGEAWYALHVRHRYEGVVARCLTVQGYPTLLPTYEDTTPQRTPQGLLFPGYVLARFQMKDRVVITALPGVLDVAGFSRDAIVPLSPMEVDGLRRVLQSATHHGPFPYEPNPQEEKVLSGPFRGLQGRVVREGSQVRLILSLTSIARAFYTEIDSADLEPMGARHQREKAQQTLQTPRDARGRET